jgi:hypothetical protein
MVSIVKGVLKDGKLELLEKPAGLHDGEVTVTLVQAEDAALIPRYLTRGKYKGGRMSTEEDFKDAEWRGEPEFDDQYGK